MCNTANPWLAYAWQDPLEQLQQLAEALLQAELNEEKVWLLSHIPTNSDGCLHAWGRGYTQLMDR